MCKKPAVNGAKINVKCYLKISPHIKSHITDLNKTKKDAPVYQHGGINYEVLLQDLFCSVFSRVRSYSQQRP